MNIYLLLVTAIPEIKDVTTIAPIIGQSMEIDALFSGLDGYVSAVDTLILIDSELVVATSSGVIEVLTVVVGGASMVKPLV